MSIGNPRRLIGRVPDLSKPWEEATPELKEFLTKLSQAVSDPEDSTADLGAAIAFFMGGSFAGASGSWTGAGAPITAEYLVGAADGTLTAERVVTDTTTVTWDLSTPAQAKANVPAGSVLDSVATPAQITGNVNDYNPGAGTIVRLSTDAARNITGLVAGSSGARRLLVNVGGFNAVLTHQDAASSAVNRFLNTTGANITLTPDQAAWTWYDATTQRWRAYAL